LRWSDVAFAFERGCARVRLGPKSGPAMIDRHIPLLNIQAVGMTAALSIESAEVLRIPV
jgi:hypothetical protein